MRLPVHSWIDAIDCAHARCSPIESSGEELDSDGDQSDNEDEDDDDDDGHLSEDAFGSLGSDAVAMSVTPDDAVWGHTGRAWTVHVLWRAVFAAFIGSYVRVIYA